MTFFAILDSTASDSLAILALVLGALATEGGGYEEDDSNNLDSQLHFFD